MQKKKTDSMIREWFKGSRQCKKKTDSMIREWFKGSHQCKKSRQYD